jgi:hypothetical protein
VLDILLTAFEHNPENLSYFKLLAEFGTENTITQLLGFKLQKIELSQSLFTLIALLLKHEVISLEGVWSHLSKEPTAEKDELQLLMERQHKSLDY